jgi:hypothetical protein
MNEHYFGEQVKTQDIVEDTDQDTNDPVGNSDPDIDKVPVLAALIQATPKDSPVAVVGPLDETIVQETPMGETILYKGAVGETIVREVPTDESIPYSDPVSKVVIHAAPLSTNAGTSVALLDRDESEHLRSRWNEIQGTFVDEPRSAVQKADALVDEVVEKITLMFATEHSSLEGQWKQDNDISTEDLRQTLQHYRSFFNRLVV